MNILVTDGEQRAALAVVRSLGRAGHRVFVCSSRARSLAGASHHCAEQAAVPDALHAPAAFVDSVAALVERWRIDVLLPMAEPALLAILPARERFPACRIPFAPHARFLEICDKARVAAAAEAVGIRVPTQLILHSLEDRERARDAIRFPLVLKSSRSVMELDGRRAKTSVVHLRGPAELDAALAEVPYAAYPVLLQERIVGPAVGVFLHLADGELVASFAHRRLREKPPSGGVSVFRESIPLDRDLLARSHALLRSFAWEGVAMVEYKLDAATGTPYIIEINGRFWGSLQLAIDSGVDFPLLLLEPGRAAAAPAYRPGVRSRWEWGDVDHLLARLRRSNDELGLPPGSPGRLRALADFLIGLAGGSRNEVFRLSDPRPFLRESLDWLRGR